MPKDDAVRFGAIRTGYLLPGSNGSIRYSSALAALKSTGADTSEFEHDKKIASICPEHGEIEDPIIAILSDRVAFACPWCSSPEIREAWEAEGKLN